MCLMPGEENALTLLSHSVFEEKGGNLESWHFAHPPHVYLARQVMMGAFECATGKRGGGKRGRKREMGGGGGGLGGGGVGGTIILSSNSWT